MRIWLLLLCLLPSVVQAKIIWQDFRLSYLYGEHYRLGDPRRQVLTFEYAAQTSWGDSFFFLDHLRSQDGSRNNYAEWQPRFSLTKNSNQTFQFGLIKDVLLAGHLEMSSQATNYLYGAGVDLAVPGFRMLQANLYRRNNQLRADNWQLTLVWAYPFKLGQQQFLLDGFLDWASGNADQRANLNLTPQLKLLVSPSLGLENPLWLGVEYVLWRNKFGIADSPERRSHENNLNLLLKWHF
ncbi:nucleoside-binding protein [Alishewanella sp. BS5-314]|uniref:outer membrane protein OmpK n=1 Tax=Alishewanella sp. BS5-314 TaxID=2755587 RepID=UPI0021BA6D1B|nr:outer membrane protein OmpK [Alishewanella sp. BS5-314]MCT8125264.1 nucleoside-binding protein [Alishewanella sp. BS5-314]